MKAPHKRCVARKSPKAANAGQPPATSLGSQNTYPTTVCISSDDGTRENSFLDDQATSSRVCDPAQDSGRTSTPRLIA